MTTDRDLQALKEQDRQHHLHPMTNPVQLRGVGPEMIVRAEGVYLYTDSGRKIMDVGSGLSNVNIGYGNLRLCEAAFKVMRDLSFDHTILGRTNPWVAALSAKLADITPPQYQTFHFGSTGSEAIESAVKIALRFWRLQGRRSKRVIISRKLSYHGNTLFAGSLTGLPFFHSQFGLPLSDQIVHVESPYEYREGRGRPSEQFCSDLIRSLESKIVEIGPENIAAFVGDVIQTGGGSIIPPTGYWPQARALCDKYEILLISDEIITGFGKTGRMFGFENFDFEPDMFVMAKGFSSGYFPISAVALGAKVNEVLQNADEVFAHVFTNCGHPVGAAVALENIAVIEEQKLVERVRSDIGPYFQQRLSELRAFPFVKEIRSLGIIGAFEVELPGTGVATTKAQSDAFLEKVTSAAWRRGVNMRGSGLFLPLIITHEQIDHAFSILKESIAEVWTEEQA